MRNLSFNLYGGIFLAGILYVVGTPIGNLGDISPRALKCLEDCDFIAAEDTRVTIRLLNHFNIKKPLISYHEHNRFERGGYIAERLLNGESCALVTDAGMPAISDPGFDLVKLCGESGVKVSCVPGPSALASALAISGIEAGRFSFEGFLTQNKPKRREHLSEMKNEKKTMILYEAPHKLSATLRDLAGTLGDRNIALVKELTKIYEGVERTSLFEAAAKYEEQKPRGEYVIIIEAAPKESPEEEHTLDEAVKTARELMDAGLAASAAAKQAAGLTGYKKGDIYKNII